MRRGVVVFAARHGAGHEAKTDVALAVSEALTNAAVHAFVGQTAGTMSLFAEAAADVLRIRVVDDGSGMAPREDSPGMGVGLTLIAQLAASVEFRPGRRGIGTELRLSFAAPGMRRAGGDL